jgi:hypothetical protein
LDLVGPQISLAERVGFRALHLRDWNRVKAFKASGLQLDSGTAGIRETLTIAR